MHTQVYLGILSISIPVQNVHVVSIACCKHSGSVVVDLSLGYCLCLVRKMICLLSIHYIVLIESISKSVKISKF